MATTPLTYNQLRHQLKLRLADIIQASTRTGRRVRLDYDVAAEQLQLVLNGGRADAAAPAIDASQQEQLIREVLQDIIGLGPLDALLADPTITEIMINGSSQIFVERNGQLMEEPATFRDNEHLMSVIERMLEQVNLSVTEANPICDASLPSGARLNVIIPPLVLNGPVVTIRRKSRDWIMEDYQQTGALSPEAAEFLKLCVVSKVNCLISGGTSTGKTTLVSILSAYIPPDERIITIENVPELELPHRKHWIRLVGRSSNIEGRGEIPLRALVKNALRMRPDRIILGEARGGEALDVVQAMHSGHDGFLTVLHANSPRAALERMETLMLMSGLDLPTTACRTQIASATDLVIHLTRLADGRRGIASITQVMDASREQFEIEDLFRFELDGSSQDYVTGSLRYTGACPKFLRKFQMSGVPIPAWLNTNQKG